MWYWISIALAITAVHTADHDVFRTCSQEPFCAQFRDQVLDSNAQFYANVSAAARVLNTVHVPLTNGNGDSLTLEVSILFGHKLRIKILESVQKRYIILYVIPLSKQDYPPTLQISGDTVTVTSTWAVEDRIVVKSGPPFTVECYHLDKLKMVLNGDRLVMKETDTIEGQAFSFTVEFEEASRLYGLAHHSHNIALRETADGSSEPFRLKNTDNTEYDADSTMALYSSIPAVYGHSVNQTSGVFLHNAAQMFVDISYTGSRPSAYFMVECGDFDLILFLGPTPRDVVRQYTSMTGITRMPQVAVYVTVGNPKYIVKQLWVFGYHQNSHTYWTQEEVTDVVAKMDQADMPIDVVFLDNSYTDGHRWFQWNPDNFSDPLKMQENISATGRRLIAVLNPHMLIDLDYDTYVAGKERDFYIKYANGSDFKDISLPGQSVWLDFLNPDARTWYAFLFFYDTYAGTTETIAAVSHDLNEPSIYNDDTERTFPPDVLHFSQIFDREIHNMYGLLYVKATDAGLSMRDLYNKRVFVLSRSFFAGSQKYAAVWTGGNTADWPYLRNSISECLTFNLLGAVLCGANVGGYYGKPTEELLQRWYQTAIWIPYFRGFSNSSDPREPYEFFEEVQSVIRLAIKTRYKHLPYWYRLMFDHTQCGDPLIRPLFYSYPEYLENDDHFLIGEEILSRPVLEPDVNQVQVIFPGSGNTWYRVDDNSWTVYQGATEQNITVDITTSPYFYRGGSIIPRMDIERPSTTQMTTDPFQLYVNLDANNNATGLLYFDDYTSLQYRTKISYFYSSLTYDFATNGVRFQNINGNPTGFNARIQRIIVNRQGDNDETITTSYTKSSDGTVLEDIDIVEQHLLTRDEGGFTIYL